MRQYKQWAALNAKFASRAKASETRLRHFDEATDAPERAVEQKVQCGSAAVGSGNIVLKAKALSIPDLLKPFKLRGPGLASAWRSLVRMVLGKSHFLRLIAVCRCATR